MVMAKRIVNVSARSPACRLQTFAFRRCLRRFVRYTAVNFALSRSRGPPDLRVYVVGFAFGSSSVVAKGRGFIGGGFAGFGPLFCFFEKKCCNPIRVTARSLPGMIDGTGTFSLEFPQILKGNVNTRNYTGT